MYFLDGTETYLAFNEYGERIQGRQCLVEDGDQFLLTNIPATTFRQNLDEEKRVLEINGTTLRGTATRIWKGEEKQYILWEWNNTKKENTLTSFKNYLSGGNSNYIITDFKTSDINNIDTSLTACYTIDCKNHTTSSLLSISIPRYLAADIMDIQQKISCQLKIFLWYIKY